jgi:hypothetical protein
MAPRCSAFAGRLSKNKANEEEKEASGPTWGVFLLSLL